MSTDPHSPDQPPPPSVQRRRYEVRDIRIRWVVGSLVGFAIFFFAMAAGIYWMLHDFARKTAVRDEPNSVVRPSEVARGGVPLQPQEGHDVTDAQDLRAMHDRENAVFQHLGWTWNEQTKAYDPPPGIIAAIQTRQPATAPSTQPTGGPA